MSPETLSLPRIVQIALCTGILEGRTTSTYSENQPLVGKPPPNVPTYSLARCSEMNHSRSDLCSHACFSWAHCFRVDAETLTNGTVSPMTCASEGCVDGAVLRGNFSDFSLPEDNCSTVTVDWNADASAVKAAIEYCSNDTRKVSA